MFDRAVDGEGVARQLAAVTASGSRAEALSKLDLPALVIHGDGDPLLTLAHGEATAKAIPNAKLRVIAGMGHDLPRGAHVVMACRSVSRGEEARAEMQP